MSQTDNLTKRILIQALGTAVCVIPVCVAILSYFPLWIRKSDACALSGIALCLILMAMVPFYKQILSILKTPASYTLWLIAFVLFFFLSRIADAVTVIALVGFISNLAGALIFKLNPYKKKGDIQNE